MYNLNINSAKAAEEFGKFISEPGKHKGKIIGAELKKSNAGTDGIEISFENESGQRVNYLSIWTRNNQGKELHGMKILNAIMACLRLRNITPANGMVDRYNKDTKQIEKVNSQVFPDLIGKRIGFLLQGEEYRDNNVIKTKLTIMAPFDADTELTAAEILDRKTSPQALSKLVEHLANNPVRKIRDGGGSSASTSNANLVASDGGFIGSHDFDDDIPF